MTAGRFEAIVLGGSAGAIDALSTILPALPASLPLPVLVVVHLPADRPSCLAEVFANDCPLVCKEAEDKEPIAPGTLYVAPPNYHLLVERTSCLSLSMDDPVHFSRPSIDVLFESAADAYGPRLVAALLTGANEDGAAGLARVRERGGVTIVEDPESAVAPAMPTAALRLSRQHEVLPLRRIGPRLAALSSASQKEGA